MIFVIRHHSEGNIASAAKYRMRMTICKVFLAQNSIILHLLCIRFPISLSFMNYASLIFTVLLAGLAWPSRGQVLLRNASFEGEPQDATVPVGWLPCQPGTTPDILPGVWGVYQEPAHGNSYIGLITREDGTWESIGQRLDTPLEAGQCYFFNLSLAHSGTYAGYNRPLKLRLWGSQDKCGKQQLIWESPLIDRRQWTRYKVEFVPQIRIQYILLEAFHKEGAFSYRGNILIDHISSFNRCNRA